MLPRCPTTRLPSVVIEMIGCGSWACCVALLLPGIAMASTLPMQNQFDPRHLDLDPAAGGSGIFVAPSTTFEQNFGDALNSAEDWYAEFLIGNPTNQAIAFDASLVWPGGGTQGPGLLQPGFAFVLKVDPTDVPETRPDWLFTFTNPLSVDLVVDASVSEALSLTQTPGDGFGFFTLDGQPADPSAGNRFNLGGQIGDRRSGWAWYPSRRPPRCCCWEASAWSSATGEPVSAPFGSPRVPALSMFGKR